MCQSKEVVSVLKMLNVKGVILSNNHIFDYLEHGVKDTIEILEKTIFHIPELSNQKNIVLAVYLFKMVNRNMKYLLLLIHMKSLYVDQIKWGVL